jgi:hypothetical protein
MEVTQADTISTFKKGVKKDQFFLYRIGNVSTNNIWVKPTYTDIQNLLIQIKKLKDFDKYELFLIGGVVNNGIGKTTDIDIVINGKLSYELEYFFHDLYRLGFDNNLLLDVRWLDKSPVNHKQEIIYQCVQFGRVYKQIDDVISEINLFDKNIMLTEHLVLRTIRHPDEKAKKLTGLKYVRI